MLAARPPCLGSSSGFSFPLAVTAQLHPKPLCAERLCGHPRPSLPLGRLLCQQVSPGRGWGFLGFGGTWAGCSLLLETPFPVSHHSCAEKTLVKQVKSSLSCWRSWCDFHQFYTFPKGRVRHGAANFPSCFSPKSLSHGESLPRSSAPP